MTPFGARIRELRAERGVSLSEMAAALQISAAYLSALEHGRRGRPSPVLVDQICGFFHIIWDDADELRRLAKLSRPKVTIDTGGLSPAATELVNRLAASIGKLDDPTLARLLGQVEKAAARPARRAKYSPGRPAQGTVSGVSRRRGPGG